LLSLEAKQSQEISSMQSEERVIRLTCSLLLQGQEKVFHLRGKTIIIKEAGFLMHFDFKKTSCTIPAENISSTLESSRTSRILWATHKILI